MFKTCDLKVAGTNSAAVRKDQAVDRVWGRADQHVLKSPSFSWLGCSLAGQNLFASG